MQFRCFVNNLSIFVEGIDKYIIYVIIKLRKKIKTRRETMMKVITRRVNRVVRVLLILLIVAFSSVGCMRKEAKFEAGNTVLPITMTTRTMMMAKSDKDTFSIDGVTVDLLYGWYDIEEVKERYNGNYKWRPEHSGSKDIHYSIYARNEKYEISHIFYKVFNDKSIDNHYLIRELSGELFTEDYGYTVGFLNYIDYNHKEQITIPKDVFEEKNRGDRIQLLIIGWVENDSGSGYNIGDMAKIYISYKYIDANTIQFY